MSAELRQGELFPSGHARTAAELDAFFKAGVTLPVDITLTRNKVRVASVSFAPAGRVKLRLHHGFLSAPERVLHAMRVYLNTRRRESWRIVAAYARSLPTGPAAPRRVRLKTRGAVFDLKRIRDDVNQRYFGGRLDCRIGWGPRGARRPRARVRTIRFGTYRQDVNLVLINPRLDHPRTPPAFVEYIVFHEMLHAVVPSVRRGERWLHHTPQFKARERSFPEWQAMQEVSRLLVQS